MDHNQESKVCQNCKSDFLIEPEDFAFYEKIKVPPPTFCPECRLRRRMTWRNERSLYKRQCPLCKKDFITIYTKESDLNVYCHDCWWSDKWDGTDFGTSYDFNKNFFLQFRDIFCSVPLCPNDAKGNQINSEYGNYNGNVKNCYLCFSTVESEDIAYCAHCSSVRQSYDLGWTQNSELCYQLTNSDKCNHCEFSHDIRESMFSNFLFSCSNVSNSFMSSNLKNGEYYFRNKKCSQVEYEQQIKNINMGSYSAVTELLKEFEVVKKSSIHKYAEIKNSIKSTGDNIINSKGIRNSFDVSDSENVYHSVRVLKNCREVSDIYGSAGAELVYEGIGCGFSPKQNLFTFSIDVSNNLTYCGVCKNSSNLFACVGLRNKQYCILNKQYTKDEYEELVPKIINHMNSVPFIDNKGRIYKYGEFFPSEISPFCYNETIAQEQFPLAKDAVETNGYRWKETEKRKYATEVKSEDIDDDITRVNESIVNKVIECIHQGNCKEQCTEAFKVTQNEFQFYQRMNLPIPRLCPNCRHYERLAKRNSFKLWHRVCMCDKSHSNHEGKCQVEFETSYAPDRSETVYCEKCYQQDVY